MLLTPTVADDNSADQHPAVEGTFHLDELEVGTRAVVKCVACKNRELRQKLLTMGLIEGSQIEVLGVAPLGDPMTIRVLGFQLSLRLSEASHVLVIPHE